LFVGTIQLTLFTVSVPLSATTTAPALLRTCHWLAAFVSPTQSVSLNAEAWSVGVSDTSVEPFAGETFVGVFGTVFGGM